MFIKLFMSFIVLEEELVMIIFIEKVYFLRENLMENFEIIIEYEIL